MKTWARYFLTAVAAIVAACAVYAAARAETCTLEIKKLESRTSYGPLDYLYRATSPQSLYAQIGPEGKNRINFGPRADQTARFKDIVKKEPKYESDHPFRGVAKFGTQEFAFALDTMLPESEKKKAESEDKDSKSKDDNAKTDDKDAKSKPAKSLAGSLLQALSGSDQVEPVKPPKAVGFNRLYFDVNHNGDLTDDKVIEAETMPGINYGGSYARFQFPRVDVTIDVDGTPVDYAFSLSGYVNTSQEYT
ncbi:MAG: hypothetical protein ABSA77_11965, partial [Thermoguttaceae bacterium]